MDPSSQERSRSLALPGRAAITPAPHASRETSTRPSADTSCSVRVAGAARSRRSAPARVTAWMAWAAPRRVPVNQISSPRGDQASPSTLFHPDDSVRAASLQSPPARRAGGVARHRMLDHGDRVARRRDADVGDVAGTGVVEHRADRILEHVLAVAAADDGELRCRRDSSRRPTRSRRAAAARRRPAARGPACPGPGRSRVGPSTTAISPFAEMAKSAGLGHLQRSRFRRVGHGSRTAPWHALPGRAVDDRLAVGGEARPLHGAAPEGELVKLRVARRPAPRQREGTRRRERQRGPPPPAPSCHGRRRGRDARRSAGGRDAGDRFEREAPDRPPTGSGRRGVFSRQRSTMRARPGASPARPASRSGGCSLRIAVSVSTGESPWNARWPDSIS